MQRALAASAAASTAVREYGSRFLIENQLTRT